MTLSYMTGAETGDFLEFYDSGGTCSIVASPVHSGSYALRCNPTTTAVGYASVGKEQSGTHTTIGLANWWCSFWFRIGTLPAANDEEIAGAYNGATLNLGLRIDSSGYLAVYDKDNAKVGSSGATQLSTGTWYRIGLRFYYGAAAPFMVTINGAIELSGTCAQYALGTGTVALGKKTNRNGNTVDFYYDDIVADSVGFPPDGKVLVLRADGDGTNTTWTIGAGGGADYENVDDAFPYDGDTTYLLSTLTAGNQSAVTLQSPSVHGLSDPTRVYAYRPCAITKRDGGTNGSIYILARFYDAISPTGVAIPSTASYTLYGTHYEIIASSRSYIDLDHIENAQIIVEERSAANRTRVSAMFIMVYVIEDCICLVDAYSFDTNNTEESSNSIIGTGSIQNSVYRTGGYALRANPVGATSGYLQFGLNSTANAVYLTFYFRVATLPAANDEEICSLGSATSAVVRIDSTGILKLYDGTTLRDTGSNALSLNTWYKITLYINVLTDVAKVYIGNTEELSGAWSIGSGAVGDAYLGKIINRNGNSVDFFYDDVIVTIGQFQLSKEYSVKLLVPNGDGSNTNWTIGAGAGSDYENVDELANDGDTTYLLSDLVAGTIESLTIPSAATLGIINKVRGVKVFGRFKSNTGGAISVAGMPIVRNQKPAQFVSTAVAGAYARAPSSQGENPIENGGVFNASNWSNLELGAYNSSGTNQARLTQLLGDVVIEEVAAGRNFVIMC